MKFYVEKNQSKKGNTYICLKADLGYRTIIVTFDTNVISTLANLTPEDIYLMNIGDKIDIK